MATTINSGYASSPKLTANIADHADVYGGRALVFDGVSDYLDTGDAFESFFKESFTLSAWIKPNDGQPSAINSIINTRNGFAGYIYFQIETNGKMKFVHGANLEKELNTFTDNVIFSNGANDWTHVAGVFNKTSNTSGSVTIYVNGENAGSNSSPESSWNTDNYSNSAYNVVIGARNSLGSIDRFFNGSITDVKFYSSALSESDIRSQYLKPESVPSPSTLKTWYPLCEGNPESPQSIVYDHSEKGKLGSEFFNNTYSSGTGGWVKYGNNGLDNDNGAVKVTYVDNAFGAYLYLNTDNDFNRNTDNTALYKFTFEAKINTGTVRLTIDQSGEKSVLNITNTEFESHTMYVTGIGGGLLRPKNMSSGQIFLIKNLSFKEVLIGNHATTNFFGDMADLINESNDSEIWDATNNRFSFTTSGWSGYDDATSLVDDTDWVKTTNIDRAKRKSDADHAFLRKSSGTYEFISHPLTLENGKTYNVSGVYSSSSTSSINVEVGASAPSSNSDYTHWATQSLTSSGGTIDLDFTAQGTTGHLVIELTGGANENAFLEHIAVREVGISSSGFMPVTNEPVVPQVPLMRYNQKMVFDGDNDKVVLDGAVEALKTQQGTINLWCIPSNDTGRSADVLFAYNFDANRRDMLLRYNWADNRLEAGLALSAQQWHFYTPTNSVTNHVGSLKMITLTHDGTQPYLYVDGIQQSITYTTQTDKTKWLGDFDFVNRCSLGLWQFTSDQNQFNGVIDDVSYFNTALTETQIQELFNDGVALDATTHSKANDYLLGYWRNDGVTTWIDRGDIQAIGFDGVSNHSILNANSIGNALGDNYTGDLSISVWFKRTQIGISGGLVDIGFDPFDLGIFTLFINSSNELTFALVDNAWNLKEDFTDKDWNHVLAVYKAGSASDTKLYLNGSSVGTATGTFPSTSDMNVNGKNTYVGLYRSVGQSFTGIIGQTAIWTKELSSIEVSEIYNLGRRNTDLTTSYSTNLLAYYLLNPTHSNPDTTGSNNILDRSGNNHHATQQNGVNFFGTNDGTVSGNPDSITIREGLNSNRDGLGFYFKNPSSNVLRLNGVDEYIDVKKSSAFSFTGDQPFTIMCWVKPKALALMAFCYKRNGSNGYIWQMHSDGTLEFSTGSATGNTLEASRSSTTISASEWTHIAVVRTGNQGKALFYKNGSLMTMNGSNDPNHTLMSDNSTIPLTIGEHGGSRYFNGLIDEFMIYNKELSLSEIQKNYKHGKGKHKND